MVDTFDHGDIVRSTVTFTDAAGDGADPTTVTFTILDPAGVETSYVYDVDVEVIRSALGIFYIDLTIDQVGIWHVRCVGTGDNAAAVDSGFNIRPSKFI